MGSARYEDPLPRDEMVSSVRVACFDGDDVIFPVTKRWGPVALPGGTREPDEVLARTIERELMEEVGVRVRRFAPVGAVRFRSDATEPYRLHLPHPEYFWLVGYAEVEIVGEPTQPEGGEEIVSVHRMTLSAAVDAILAHDAEEKAWEVALLTHVAELRAAARA